jgi:hypothetical protein
MTVRVWASRYDSDTQFLRVEHVGTTFELAGVGDSGRVLFYIEQDDPEYEPVRLPLIENISWFRERGQFVISKRKELSVLVDLHPDIAIVQFYPCGLIKTFDAEGWNMFAWTQKLPQPPSYEEISRLFEGKKIPVFVDPGDVGLSAWINTSPFFIEMRDDGIHLYNRSDETAALVVPRHLNT